MKEKLSAFYLLLFLSANDMKIFIVLSESP